MKYTIALLLASAVLAKDKKADEKEIKGTDITIVKNDDYRMDLKYWVTEDKDKKKVLMFESTLVASKNNTYTPHQYISQWYQLGDAPDPDKKDDKKDDKKNDKKDSKDEPYWEMVQATLRWHESALAFDGLDWQNRKTPLVAEEDTFLHQTCGTKLQETYDKTDYDKRVEKNSKASKKCSPWKVD